MSRKLSVYFEIITENYRNLRFCIEKKFKFKKTVKNLKMKIYIFSKFFVTLYRNSKNHKRLQTQPVEDRLLPHQTTS